MDEVLEVPSNDNAETKLESLREELTEKLTCCICNDIFKTFNRCVNNHGVCEFCCENLQETICPLCRAPISEVSETITSNIAAKIDLQVKCCTCNNMIDITKIEHHRNWCEEQLFTCPARGVCNKMLRSSELYDHLMHHDRNIVLLEDTNELVFTFVNSSENHILVLLKDTKHIVDISWCGLRSDVGRPLISISAKCYYPCKKSKTLSVNVSHYNILSSSSKPIECFSLNRIEPMFSIKEPAPPVPFGIITPVLKLLNERQFADIKVLKDETCINAVSSEYKREVTEYHKIYARETRRRQFMSMICAQRDAVAFLSIKVSLGEDFISELF